MARAKFRVGEPVEVLCYHHDADEQVVYGWLAGVVVEADRRMIAVRFNTVVYTTEGSPTIQRTLWSAHGSPRVRRPGETG